MRNFLTSCPLWPSRVARLCRGIMIPRHEVHPPSQEFDIASDLVTDYHLHLPEGSGDWIGPRFEDTKVEFAQHRDRSVRVTCTCNLLSDDLIEVS